jgi:hypothetical protein
MKRGRTVALLVSACLATSILNLEALANSQARSDTGGNWSPVMQSLTGAKNKEEYRSYLRRVFGGSWDPVTNLKAEINSLPKDAPVRRFFGD